LPGDFPSCESVDLGERCCDEFEHFVGCGMTAIDVLYVGKNLANVLQRNVAAIEHRAAATFDLAQNRNRLRDGFGRVEQLIRRVVTTLYGIERCGQAFSSHFRKLNGFHEASSKNTNGSKRASA
jgi:hypothetical protein